MFSRGVGRRTGLQAVDEVERRLLADFAALPDGRERAAKVLGVSRVVIDRMWTSSPGRPRREMRLSEARALARDLGLELELTRTIGPARERAIRGAISRQDAAQVRRAAEQRRRTG